MVYYYYTESFSLPSQVEDILVDTPSLRRHDMGDDSPLGISMPFRGLGGFGNIRYNEIRIKAIKIMNDLLFKWSWSIVSRFSKDLSVSRNPDNGE